MFDFGPDSLTLTVEDLVQQMTKISHEILMATWSLLESQKQDFLSNHLAKVPLTPNQEGTMGKRDEVLSSVSAQDVDTSGHQVSTDLDDVEFYWDIDRLDVDARFRLGNDTPFSPIAFDGLEKGRLAENLILLDKKDKNSPPPTTPVFERPTQPPALLRSHSFGTRVEIVS